MRELPCSPRCTPGEPQVVLRFGLWAVTSVCPACGWTRLETPAYASQERASAEADRLLHLRQRARAATL